MNNTTYVSLNFLIISMLLMFVLAAAVYYVEQKNLGICVDFIENLTQSCYCVDYPVTRTSPENNMNLWEGANITLNR